MIVAIDGPAGAGKSTIARSLARRLRFTYIDSGAMFRAIALWAIRVNFDLDDLHRLEQLAREARIEFEGDSAVLLNGEDVTGPSAIPKFRRPLRKCRSRREFARLCAMSRGVSAAFIRS